jgi:hypothetical protein
MGWIVRVLDECIGAIKERTIAVGVGGELGRALSQI